MGWSDLIKIGRLNVKIAHLVGKTKASGRVTKKDLQQLENLTEQVKDLLQSARSDPQAARLLANRIAAADAEYDKIKTGIDYIKTNFKLNKDGVYVSDDGRY